MNDTLLEIPSGQRLGDLAPLLWVSHEGISEYLVFLGREVVGRR
jgi:hypothetical protein